MNYIENGLADNEFVCSKKIPNIFLIGDSIRQGYCATVKSELEGVAEVFYVEENCRNTQYVITSLEGWKNKFDNPSAVDIVQFNCGHWDTACWSGYDLPLTSEQEYAKNIKMIIYLIRSKFPGAKIVFATTTTMNPAKLPCLNFRDNAIIGRYNEIAKNVAAENGVEINDLNAVTCNWTSDKYRDYCHFTAEGSTVLGKAVADKLRSLL